MTSIKKLYAVVSSEDGVETICALAVDGGMLQAVSSLRELAEETERVLRMIFPQKSIWIAEFDRKMGRGES